MLAIGWRSFTDINGDIEGYSYIWGRDTNHSITAAGDVRINGNATYIRSITGRTSRPKSHSRKLAFEGYTWMPSAAS